MRTTTDDQPTHLVGPPHRRNVPLCGVLVALMTTLLAPMPLQAFCGFYVSGADTSLYANATMVVMMREGRRTVLSMQNNYQGPPQDFAMVVPVPEVLQEDNVRTLPKEVFSRVDQLAAPRLVEYWEADPCNPMPAVPMRALGGRFAGRRLRSAPQPSAELGVTVEAQFTVEEYEIVILSARDSSGLDTWLRQEQYNIPEGSEAVLRPYVEQGTKFFVAKVDSSKVRFQNGRALLSPLRFHYETDTFSLPVRLGLLNSSGQQDLIVHVLARGQRYEVANYANATIPTNLRVKEDVRSNFAGFYDVVFRRAAGMAPRTVVTEYSWDASSCDPCPVPALTPGELATLGADVLHGAPATSTSAIATPVRPPFRGRRARPSGFVLTRLHYRYGRDGLDEDLVFRAAPPLVGGRGMPDRDGRLREQEASGGSVNNFQGRYVLLNRWEGEIACSNPQRGLWGGPPGQGRQPRTSAPENPAMNVPASMERVAAIGPLVEDTLPQFGIRAGVAEAPAIHDPGPLGAEPASTTPATADDGENSGNPASSGDPSTQLEPQGGCASCATTGASTGSGGWALLAMALLLWRRWLRCGQWAMRRGG